MSELQPKTRRLLDLWLVVIAGLLAWYVLLHPPLTVMAQHLAPLLFALAFVLSYAGLGDLPSRWLLPSVEPADRWLVAVALGIGLTGALVFFCGLAGVLEPGLWAVWTLGGLVLFAVGVWRDGGLPRPPRPGNTALALFAVALLAVVVILILPYTLAPPASTDALEYHLLIPKIYLQMGKIDLIPSLVESNYPCLAPFLYLPVMTLAGDVACNALHLWIGLASLAVLMRLRRRLGEPREPYLAPALFLSMPVAALPFAVAWNDAFFVFFMLLALYLLVEHHAASERGWRLPVAAGILAGLAAWTKYTIVMFVFALALLFLWALVRWGWRLGHVLCFAAPLGLLSLLPFGKNYAFTGNPFYPFLASIFPSPAWTAAADAHFHNALRVWEIADWSWHTYLSFPLHIVLWPRLIDIHPGLVPLLLLAFLFGRVHEEVARVRFLRLFMLCVVLVWLLIHTENRSLLTLFAVLIVVGSARLEGLTEGWPELRRPLIALLIALSLTNLGVLAVNTAYLTEPFAYFIGRETRAQYLAREAEGQQVFAWLDASAGVDRVLLVGFPGPYHLQRIAYFSSFSDPPIAEQLSRGVRSVEELASRLRALGISHIAVDTEKYRLDHENRLYSWSPSERRVFEELLAERCEEKARFGTQVVFELR